MTTRPPAIVHIPHSSTYIPATEAARLAVGGDQLRLELLRMTDWFTDELFDLPRNQASRVMYPYSRLLVDPERYEDDARETMAERGMGAVYTRTSHGATLRADLAPRERKRLLETYYHHYHETLTRTVAAAVDTHGRCLILDAHSFPTTPLPCDQDQAPDRPDICIGTDAVHTPPALRDAAAQAFTDAGYRVAIDRPYEGTMVPAAFLGAPRVQSIMVEVRRGLYMDEATGSRNGTFAATRLALQSCLAPVIEAAHAT